MRSCALCEQPEGIPPGLYGFLFSIPERLGMPAMYARRVNVALVKELPATVSEKVEKPEIALTAKALRFATKGKRSSIDSALNRA